QLTVMFCDVVDSTKLSSQLDPEEYRDVVRAYQRVCTDVIQRYDGHIAQLLGDGLLVYFGFPQAHEDDAQRAVRAGLGILNDLGAQTLRGVAEPITVYHILRESGGTSRLDVAQPRGLTPLVGRESEVILLLERWEQAKVGHGHVVLLTGDAGIGKSRLVQML